MPRKNLHTHTATEFDLDITLGDDDLFRWFLLCYLFGKPIRSETAVSTWKLFIKKQLDNPWAILKQSDRALVNTLHNGGYTRYQHVTAHGLHVCMERLIREYEGSLHLMIESSYDQDELKKRLQSLYGVGPKIAEIFAHETDEIFARRVE